METRPKKRAEKFRVSDVFYTVQGEGPGCGDPSLFVRLQGCNLRCPWCDEPGSLDIAGDARLLSPYELYAEAAVGLARAGAVVFTGGEPMLQAARICTFIDVVRTKQPTSAVRFTIETNGTVGGPYVKDLIRRGVLLVISPKDRPHVTGANKVNEKLLRTQHVIKLVVEDNTDIEGEYRKYKQYHRGGTLPWFYLQPEDGVRAKVLPRITKFVLEHPREARHSMRIHKELGVK